jgi:hypothetical protein
LFLHNDNKLPTSNIIKTAFVNKSNLIWLILLIILLYKRDLIFLLLEDLIYIEIYFFKPILCEGTGMSGKYFQHSEKTTFNLRGSSKSKRVLRATDFIFKNRWTNIDEDNVAETIRRRDTHWYGSLNDSAVDPTQFKADCYLLHNYLLFYKEKCPNYIFLPPHVLSDGANSFIGKYLRTFSYETYITDFNPSINKPRYSRINIVDFANELKSRADSTKSFHEKI